MSRRQIVGTAVTAMGAAALRTGSAGQAAAQATLSETTAETMDPSFQYCLNTSTLRGQNLSLVEEIEIASQAGYVAIEPWIDEIRRYQESGGSLPDLAKRCSDLGLEIPSAIGFAEWIVDDPTERARGLEIARRDMELVRQIGGTRIAAPPAGAVRDAHKIDLLTIAERYGRLLDVGAAIGVVAQVELWGFSRNLSRLGEAVLVAVESGHPDACVLPDVYHIYKGGSDFTGLRLLAPTAIQCFHLNDYPAKPARADIEDSHRVYPGDGVAPLNQILASLAVGGRRCMLSLELFNREYWEQDALSVAATGLRKSREAVARSRVPIG